MHLITAKELRDIIPQMSVKESDNISTLLNSLCPKYGINTRLRLASFIAQCAHESGNFKKKSENLNYDYNGLINTFSFYRKNPALAKRHGRTGLRPADQVAIGNTAYADINRNQDKKLGNTYPGDGYLLRGGGFIQITGRDMYSAFAKYVGLYKTKDDVKQVAALVRSDDAWAMESALWVFCIEKKLLDEADMGNIVAITRKINGALTGYEERREIYMRARKVLNV